MFVWRDLSSIGRDRDVIEPYGWSDLADYWLMWVYPKSHASLGNHSLRTIVGTDRICLILILEMVKNAIRHWPLDRSLLIDPKESQGRGIVKDKEFGIRAPSSQFYTYDRLLLSIAALIVNTVGSSLFLKACLLAIIHLRGSKVATSKSTAWSGSGNGNPDILALFHMKQIFIFASVLPTP